MMYSLRFTLFAVSVAIASLARAAGLSPEESLKHFTPAEGLEVTLAAGEPAVRQPVNVNFDGAGGCGSCSTCSTRSPPGSSRSRWTRWLRTTYDQCPMPPPYGPKGADRITIFEDPDEHGHYRKSKDFLTGLNLATSVEFGHGGVWVLQTPYLLFYPDRDGDDVPDGAAGGAAGGLRDGGRPRGRQPPYLGTGRLAVRLPGEHMHRGVEGEEFQQAAWRYHPTTQAVRSLQRGRRQHVRPRVGCHGNLLTGTNYNNFVMVHYVQGGYFIKGFAKHGPLHNPYAFGYFDHVPHAGWRGGHVTSSGLIYQGGALPADRFDGKWIAPNLLTNEIDTHVVRPSGSSFKTEFEGVFLGSTDPCFRPVDVRTGPDGAIYVADWYDRRANHVIPEDTWDKDTGRVWRVGPRGSTPSAVRPLEGAQRGALKRLTDPNDWYARTARRILADRRDPSVIPALEGDRPRERRPRGAAGPLGPVRQRRPGRHDRRRTAQAPQPGRPRLDRPPARRREADRPVHARPARGARKSDPSPVVRSQLPCSARRLPSADALPILRELMLRDADAGDRYIPLLIWWAVEQQVSASPARRGRGRSRCSTRPRRGTPRSRGRRCSSGSPAGWRPSHRRPHLEACARLLAAAPSREDADKLLSGMDLGLQGANVGAVPDSLRDAVESTWRRGPTRADARPRGDAACDCRRPKARR